MGLTRPRAHQLQDSDFKASCRAISTSNITLSGGAPATVDGVSLSAQDRVLVTGQTSGAENGLYRVTTVGTGSNGTWVRSADADATGDITAGMTVMVTEGSTYADTSWKLTTNDPITVGTTALTFEQASAYGFGTVTVDGTSLVADTVGDTLTVSEGTNISLSSDAGTDTFTIATVDAPTFSGNLTAGNLTTAGQMQADLIRNREQRYTTSNMMKFNQLYTGGANGTYFTQNEYQKIVTITPDADSQNYQVSGRILAQSAGSIQTINFIAALRSNTLPDLDWSITYDEQNNGVEFFKPQLWTKETTTAGFIFAIQYLHNSNLYGTVTVDLDVIPRSSDQLDNVTINTTQDSEQTSIDAGFTANDMTLVRSIENTAVTFSGNITGGNLVTANDVTTATVTATGNVTAGNLVTSGTVTVDRLALTSSQTTVSPLQLTASNLQDGVGALRIDGAQADIFLNPATATHTTVTFAVNDDQRLAFGMDNNSDFYITRRTGGSWYDDTLVIDRDTGDVALGYTLTATGNVTAGNLTTAGALSVGEVISDLIPDADVTRDLGSPTKQWHSVYVGPGSLYINGQKVLEEDAGTIVVGADENQNISLTTTGTGDIEFNPGGTIELKGNVVLAAGKTMSQAGGAASEFSAGVKSDSVTSRTADTNLTLSANGTGVVNVNDSLTVANDVTVTGNLTVNGATTTVSSTNTTIEDALIVLVDGQSGAPTKDAGLVIDRGSSTNVAWMWDESADQFVAVTTSEDGTTAGDVTITDYTDIRVGSATIDDTLTLGGTAITATATELNYVDGVTSAIQTQLDAKTSYSDSDVDSHLNQSNPTSGYVLSWNGSDYAWISNAGYADSDVNSLLASWGSNTLSTTGNITGGNLITTGLTSTGNLTVTASGTIEFNENVLGNIGTPVAGTDAATKQYVDDALSSVFTITDGTTSQTIADGDTLTFSGTSNEVEVAVSATDTVTIGLPDDVTLGGGLTATTTVTATGNVTGGNLITSAQVVATGNVTGGNLITGAQVVATGNVTGGNLITGAQVVATGNVTGGNLIASTDIEATGDLHLKARGEVRLYDTDSSNYVALRTGSVVASNVTFNFPVQDGTSGQVLQTDGAGTLTFATASGGGGASGYQSSTISTHPAAGGNEDLATGPNDDTVETPFESGAQDAFGVSLGTVYDQMEPVGTTITVDLGDSEAYVGA